MYVCMYTCVQVVGMYVCMYVIIITTYLPTYVADRFGRGEALKSPTPFDENTDDDVVGFTGGPMMRSKVGR